jgi:hypothetical protein
VDIAHSIKIAIFFIVPPFHRLVDLYRLSIRETPDVCTGYHRSQKRSFQQILTQMLDA